MRNYLVLLTVCVLISANSAWATTLIGIWTPKRITIAADCKQTVMDIAGKVLGAQTACKIYEVHGVIVAFAGLARAEEIDVVGAIRAACELHEMSAERALPFDGPVVAAQAALERILSAKGDRVPHAEAEMLMAGTVDGKLRMRYELLGMEKAPGAFWPSYFSKRSAYPDDETPRSTRQVIVVGRKAAINRYKASEAGWSEGKDAEVASRLIALEIADPNDSVYVGSPISEVEITHRSTKWLQRGACTQ